MILLKILKEYQEWFEQIMVELHEGEEICEGLEKFVRFIQRQIRDLTCNGETGEIKCSEFVKKVQLSIPTEMGYYNYLHDNIIKKSNLYRNLKKTNVRKIFQITCKKLNIII